MNSKKGFTLVEILIVVVIVGILLAIALSQFTDEANQELSEYSRVHEYMRSNYCVKIEYSQLGDGEIHLVRGDNYKVILPLNSEDFFKLKEMLKKGGDLETWTFELVVTDPPGAPDSLVWNGTRSQKQKEI